MMRWYSSAKEQLASCPPVFLINSFRFSSKKTNQDTDVPFLTGIFIDFGWKLKHKTVAENRSLPHAFFGKKRVNLGKVVEDREHSN